MALSPRRRRLYRLCVFLCVLACLWVAYAELTLLRPPRDLPRAPAYTRTRDADGTLRYGPSYLRRHGGVWELGLAGDPVALGDAHASLARELMIRVEEQMFGLFAHYVPSAFFRGFITTLVRGQHVDLPRQFPRERLQEVAAEARAFAPGDPFERFLPTYHRLLTLHALYDISLSFEHSPLLGCSAFYAGGAHSRDGHTWVGRNFDMEIHPVFDREKVVQLFRPAGRIPFAAVSWPGLTGVLTGLNLEGIFVAVHGARAGTPRSQGVPVPSTLREVLERAHSLEEAIAVVRSHEPMVSHLLLVVDGDTGEGAVLERAPGFPLRVRRLGQQGGVANHYFDPTLAADARNQSVREHTSTLSRQQRLDELLARYDGRMDADTTLSVLRDHEGPGDAPVARNHRGALDAWIATHSVLADATARVLWVSAAPHTLGRYERFDLRVLLGGSEFPRGADVEAGVLPADPALQSGAYATWQRAHDAITAAESNLRREPARALAQVDEALRSLPEGDADGLRLRARALAALHRNTEARSAWRAVLQRAASSPAEQQEARASLRSLGVTP